MNQNQLKMNRYSTAKLHFDRFFGKFMISRNIDIYASSFEEAEEYCEIYHPDLVVCEEHSTYEEQLRIGRHKFNFNYN